MDSGPCECCNPGGVTRRRFVNYGIVGAAALLATPTAVLASKGDVRLLSLHNLHTGERLQVEYWRAGRAIPEALREINRVLRDHRSGDVTRIDVDLLNLLHALGRRLETRQPFHVVSGYRSPKTNEALRQAGRKVAKKSYHTKGKAIDISLPGRDLRDLHRAALSLKAGGVGFYPRPGFIHVDTGPVRHWG